MIGDAPHDFVFYAPDLTTDDTELSLYGDEHRHAQVLRMQAGDALYVTNGSGLMVHGSIRALESKTTVVAMGPIVPQRDNGPSQLAIALLRKEAFDQVVRQATEVGVTRIIPFVAHKCHVREYGENYLDRLRRIALAAMKQSFRANLPSIEAPISFETLLARVADGAAVTVADVDGQDPVGIGENCIGVVGPEAGMTGDELSSLRAAGCRFARLSPHRLRAETAALLMSAALNPPV